MWPTTIANWYISPSPPRLAGGAVSAMYIGEAIEQSPTPSPPTARKTLKTRIVAPTLVPGNMSGTAVTIALTASRTDAAIIVDFRPIASHSHAPTNGPKMQPTTALP